MVIIDLQKHEGEVNSIDN